MGTQNKDRVPDDHVPESVWEIMNPFEHRSPKWQWDDEAFVDVQTILFDVEVCLLTQLCSHCSCLVETFTALILVETFDVFDLDFFTPAVFSKLAFPSELIIERILATVNVLSYTLTKNASPKCALISSQLNRFFTWHALDFKFKRIFSINYVNLLNIVSFFLLFPTSSVTSAL